MDIPKLDHYVNDASKVLSESVRHEVNERLKNHDTQTTVQAVVYLFPHRQGRELLDIGLEIFNENGIGQKDTNNGLLLIVATEEKKLRIITGKGMEFEWNTEKCKYIVEQILRPLLNAGKYDEMAKAWCDCVEGKQDNLPSKKSTIRSLSFQNKFIIAVWSIPLGIVMGTSFDPTIPFQEIDWQGIIVFMVIVLIILGILRFVFGYFRTPLCLFIFGILIHPGLVAQEYLIFSNQCTSVQTCRITDTTNEKWKKFQLYRQEEIKKAEAAQKLIEEDKRLHPEKYKSSSDSDSSSSSSDSDFGGGGGSSNGGGYGD